MSCPRLRAGCFVFLCFLSSGEDGIDKSPNPFGCNFQCIQERLGFLFQLHDIFRLLLHTAASRWKPSFERMPVSPFKRSLSALAENAVGGIAFQRVAFIRCQRDIVSERGFLAHRFNILHRKCNGLCCLGFLLQSFQFLFLLFRSSFSILQTRVLPVPPVLSQLPNAAVPPAP